MEQSLNILNLIENNTLNSDMAALLWQAVSEKKSFLTSALYRNAGKTTLIKAILSLRSENVPLHYVSENSEISEKLLGLEKKGGYLVVSEFNPAGVPGYIWGEEVRQVFNFVKRGYSLAATLHAQSAEEAMLEITSGNGVGDEEASLVNLTLHIEMLGSTAASVQRRLSQIFEVHYVENGKAMGHTLYEWNQDADTFEKTAEAHLFAKDKELLQKRSKLLLDMVNLGKTKDEDLKDAIESFSSVE